MDAIQAHKMIEDLQQKSNTLSLGGKEVADTIARLAVTSMGVAAHDGLIENEEINTVILFTAEIMTTFVSTRGYISSESVN